MKDYCSWCSKPLVFGSPGSLSCGTNNSEQINFCPNCAPHFKPLIREWGINFPAVLDDMRKNYDEEFNNPQKQEK